MLPSVITLGYQLKIEKGVTIHCEVITLLNISYVSVFMLYTVNIYG